MNYSELTAQIQSWTENFGAEFVAALPEIIQKAEEQITRAVRIPSMLKKIEAVVTTNAYFIDAPEDAEGYLMVRVTVANVSHLMSQKDPSFIQEAFPGTGPVEAAVPRFYAVYGPDKLMLGPPGAGPYELEITYFARPLSITDPAASGESWLGTHAESVLFYGCLAEAYVFMKGEQELQARYRARFDEALAQLKLSVEGERKTDDFRLDRRRVA